MSDRNLSRPAHDLDIRDCDVRLLWAQSREVLEPYLTGKSRARERTVCWCVKEGGVRVESAEKERDWPAGHWGHWVFPGRDARLHRFEPGSRILSIHFQFRMRGGDPVFPRERGFGFPVSDDPGLLAAAERLVADLAPWNGGSNLNLDRGLIPLQIRFRIESSLHEWMSQYIRMMRERGEAESPVTDMDSRVALAMMMIEEFPMHEKFSEKTLAAKCGLSVNQLIRLFKMEVKNTPYEYYEARREELALHAVGESSLPFKEISYTLGFGSPSHFSRWFSTRIGMSPRQYRRNFCG